MPHVCISPACEAMGCFDCNCALPDHQYEFEGWYRRYTGNSGYACPKDAAGNYVHAELQGLWRAWLAAIVAGASKPSDGLAALVDELDEMVGWAYAQLHRVEYSKQEDALMLDAMKLRLLTRPTQ